jgi:hypothetical protein
MIYTSIDIETSGLNPEQNQVLSIGAIIEDTTKKLNFEEIPKFNALILQHQINGSPRALTMNKGIIELIGEYLEGDDDVRRKHDMYSGYKFLKEDDVAKEFYYFLYNELGDIKGEYERPPINGNSKNILINVAGKNFGTFDKLFLEKLPWWKKLIQPKQRIIDPSVLYCKWDEDDALPSLTKCKERAGIKGAVSHDALADAWDVIQVLRKSY